MDYSFYLKTHTPNKQKLLNYGFKYAKGVFVFNTNLKTKDLVANIQISTDKLEVQVIDKNFNEEYLPFKINKGDGNIKTEVEQVLTNIIQQCFNKTNFADIVIDYIKTTFNTEYEQPWDKYNNHYTFKTKNTKKWFALLMQIKASSLGIDKEENILVLNLKLDKNEIEQLIDNKHYFPAYHMNKTYWITVVLNNTTNLKQVFNLINKSYNLVEK